MAHAIGGLYDLPHGLCCALALPHAMEFNLESRRDRFEQIAQVMGVETPEDTILRVRQLMSDIGIPAHLFDLDIRVSEAELEQLTDLTFADGSILFNPVQPTREQVCTILHRIATYEG
jgi:1,3-propanediol dehydrogenase